MREGEGGKEGGERDAKKKIMDEIKMICNYRAVVVKRSSGLARYSHGD